MIDRFTLTASQENLESHFQAKASSNLSPRYNIAPSQSAAVITQKQSSDIQIFTWGLIANMSNNKRLSPKLFNLPLETALNKPSQRKVLELRRCIVLASGFYLWKPIAKKKSTPYYIFFDQPIALAGVWEEKDEFEDNAQPTFMVVTVPAPNQLTSYQEDIPLILNEEQRKTWFSSSDSLENISGLLSQNTLPEYSIHPVAPLIANIELDSEELIQPSRPSDQFGNYTLFN